MFVGAIDCPHARECPGCPLIDRSYGAGLAEKRARLVRTVARFSVLSGLAVQDAAPADPVVGYRTRSKLVVDGGRVGLYAKGTHAVVDVPECRVMDPGAREIVRRLRESPPDAFGLSAIDVRRVGDRFFLTLVVLERADERAVRAYAEELARREPSLVSVAMSRRAESAHRVLGDAPAVLVGPSRVAARIRDDGPFHYATPGAFAQAHAAQERALSSEIVAEVARTLDGVEGRTVLELFSGASALGLELAARGARVTAVESFAPAAALARDAAREQHLDVTVEIGDAGRATKAFRAAGRRFDAVVVNPPRRGLPADLRADVAALSPRALLYVSCEPATLARDLADFRRLGLSARRLQPYDMMPLTEEIETLAALEPSAAPPPDVLFRDGALVAVVKPPHEPTTPQGEHAGSLLDRVRLLDGAADAVPVHRLDAGTSGICLFARNPADVSALSRALEAGRKEYTALVRGITHKKGAVGRPLLENGKERAARTRYWRRDVVAGHSLVDVVTEHGRKHQIRRHLASIGHPVVGDARYGDERTNRHFFAQHHLDRPFLHCGFVRLERPGAPLELRAPLAPDLELCLDALAREK